MIKLNKPMSEDQDINLTPLIDVLFILIIFFMLTIGSVLKSLNVDLPDIQEEKKVLQIQNQNIVLEVSNTNYKIEDKNYRTIEDVKKSLENILSDSNKGYQLIIAVDKNTTAERFLRILSILKSYEHIKTEIILEN